MKQNLFLYSFREFYRSANFGKSVAATVMLAFLGLYFASLFFVLGVFLIPEGLAEKFPDGDLTSHLNGFLLYYFAVDLIMRQLMQSLPTVGFKSLLVLNIKRKRIAAYMLHRSLFHFFNLLPLFLLLPLFVRLVVPDHTAIESAAWLVTMLLLILTSNYLTTYIKWWVNQSTYGLLVFAAVFAGLWGVNYLGWIDMPVRFGQMIDTIFRNPVWVIAVFGVAVLFYGLNRRYLVGRMYLNLVEKQQKDSTVRDYNWISRLGDYGKFISLEVRMILRNKRPRTQFLITVLFLAYGFLIYKPGQEGIPEGMLILGGLLMTGMFSISIGQFFPAWHSRYFSMLMTQNFRMKQFLQSFYYMNVVVSFIYFLVTLGYGLIDSRIFYFNAALFFYHVGVNLNLIFLFGLYSKKAVDLEGSAMFNYQGVGASQFLISLPMIVGPIILFYAFKVLAGSIGALVVIGLMGIAGVLLQPHLMNYFEQAYKKQKHRLIRDYKNS